MSQNSNQKNFLFYSNYCQHSRKLISRIYKTHIRNNLLFCCIDNDDIVIPPFVTSVPTIYLRDQRKVLVDTSLNQWINMMLGNSSQNFQSNQINYNQSQQSTIPQNNSQQHQFNQQLEKERQEQLQQMQQNQQQSQQQQSQQSHQQSHQQPQNNNPIQTEQNNDIMAFYQNEMSSNFSDSYSFIDDSQDNPIHHSYSFIDGMKGNMPFVSSIETPKETTSNNSKKGNNVGGKIDTDYEKLLNQRKMDLNNNQPMRV